MKNNPEFISDCPECHKTEKILECGICNGCYWKNISDEKNSELNEQINWNDLNIGRY